MAVSKVFRDRQQGFSLLEIAMVLVIMGALLGSVLEPFGASFIEKKRKASVAQLYDIRDALLGFAITRHRLPCPVITGDQPEGDCTLEHGFVPAALLGVSGRYNSDGLLLDAWGVPLKYSVSGADADGDGVPDFTTAGEMADVGLQFLAPQFEICDESTSCRQLRANQIPVVLVSEGAMRSTGSADELENRDSDNRFVSRDFDTSGDDQYDDLVVWLSENILYTELVKAAVLP
ncbi:hypothetical protein AB833_25675 [Chromatiales bacterium (ex Bugula neritina AB1)]|nr:hypothetical protein AB833_25675 [Chromatiales bacterium (ex Bugula neritina AB1)]